MNTICWGGFWPRRKLFSDGDGQPCHRWLLFTASGDLVDGQRRPHSRVLIPASTLPLGFSYSRIKPSPRRKRTFWCSSADSGLDAKRDRQHPQDCPPSSDTVPVERSGMSGWTFGSRCVRSQLLSGLQPRKTCRAISPTALHPSRSFTPRQTPTSQDFGMNWNKTVEIVLRKLLKR